MEYSTVHKLLRPWGHRWWPQFQSNPSASQTTCLPGRWQLGSSVNNHTRQTDRYTDGPDNSGWTTVLTNTVKAAQTACTHCRIVPAPQHPARHKSQNKQKYSATQNCPCYKCGAVILAKITWCQQCHPVESRGLAQCLSLRSLLQRSQNSQSDYSD